MKFLSVIMLVALLPGLALARMPEATEQTGQGSGTGIDLTLTLPLYEIAQDEAGFDVIQVEGFNLSGEPDAALLPRRVHNVAVPPDAAFDNLSVQVISGDVAKLPGTYNLKPAVPDVISTGFVDDNVPHAPHSVSSSGVTPSDFVRLLPPGQMRKWRFARLEFSPFYYDTGSGELTIARQLTVHIDYTTDRSLSAQDTALLGDSVMDDAASELLVNFDTAQGWYRSLSGQDQVGLVYDYVIITANAIEAGSGKLANFVGHKQSRGHSVLVITEDEYGSMTGQAPNGTAEKMRQWLIDNYVGYSMEYVLLIGDPDPDDPSSGSDSVGDVPMKMCWPNREPTHPNYAPYPESPTDAFYADLTGNWDLDGDGYFGEWSDYQGTDGVDFANEVYIARIPVYGGAYTTLDNILQKIIDYESEVAPANWRKSALLPMSFSDAGTDGAYLAEQMTSVYLNSAGYSSWTMYQQGSGPCDYLNSTFDSDEELYGSSVVRDRWSAGDYGLALWWAHGSQTGAYIGYNGCSGGTLFSSSDASYLDDDHPSFVYQNSCTNGYPENSNNLQYALLKQGAIGTVGATRVSWYSPGQTQFADSTTNAGIGYEYAERLVQNNLPAGKALCGTKASTTPTSSARLMNFYDFNLYGDPSTGLTSTAADVPIAGLAAGNDSPTVPGTATTFTATVSAGTNVSYAWDFGDEETGSGTPVTHTYGAVGTYTATVTATNSVNVVTDTTGVIIADVPISGLSASNDGPTELASITSLSAVNTAGSNVSYEWGFGDGELGSGTPVTHTYGAVGTYTAIVTASNPVGVVTDTTGVVITDAPISGLSASNDSLTLVGETTTLSATVSAGTNVSYSWQLGDGQASNESVLSHTYPAVGVYNAVVTASNTTNSRAATTTVTIYQESAIEPWKSQTIVYTNAQGLTTALQIPDEAITQTGVSLVYTPVSVIDETPEGDFSFAGTAFDLDAYRDEVLQTDFTFGEAIIVEVNYADADIVGLNENSLRLYYWEEDPSPSRWVDAGTTSHPDNPSLAYDRHPDDNLLRVSVCHLTEFALFGEQYRVYLPVILKNE